MFARSWHSSEGEDIALNIGNICGKFAAACSEHEEGDIFLLLDSADSGLSIDNVIDLKDILHDIIRTMSNEKRNVYIIISANEYELAANENCEYPYAPLSGGIPLFGLPPGVFLELFCRDLSQPGTPEKGAPDRHR